MTNKKIIAIIIAIIIVFLGIFTFANTSNENKDKDDDNQTIIEDEDDEENDEEEVTEEETEEENTSTVTKVSADKTAPVIILNGSSELYIDLGTTYVELGAKVTDNRDDDKNASISGNVDNTIAGVYTLTYSATDAAGNKATIVTRTVYVRPVITVLATKLNHVFGTTYVEQQAGFSSDMSKPSTIMAATSSNVDPNTVGGPYYVRFNASANGVDALEKVIEVMVVDEEKPVITSVDKTPSTEWANTDVTVTINATDNDEVSEYSFDGGNTWDTTNSKVFDATETFEVVVRDASKLESDKQEVNVKIDRQDPTVGPNVKESVQAGTYIREEMLAYITTEDLESGVATGTITYNSETGDYTFSSLGETIVNYVVKDNAGNETSLAVAFNIIDTQGPTCEIEKTPNSEWSNDHYTLKVKASDNYALNSLPYSFGFGDGTFDDWTAVDSRDYYNEGIRTIDILVRDNSPLINTTTCSVTIKIDKTAPTISDTIRVEKRLYTSDEMKNFVKDSLSGVNTVSYCKENAGICNYVSTGFDFSNLSGTQILKVKAMDNAGNILSSKVGPHIYDYKNVNFVVYQTYLFEATNKYANFSNTKNNVRVEISEKFNDHFRHLKITLTNGNRITPINTSNSSIRYSNADYLNFENFIDFSSSSYSPSTVNLDLNDINGSKANVYFEDNAGNKYLIKIELSDYDI